MTNDLISRQAAIDAPEKLIKDCNPDHFVGHQKFIEYMDNAEIGSFGNWQFANGFNMGLTAAEVAIKNLPSAQPDVLACGTGELNVLDTNVGDMISRQAAITLPVMPKEHREYQTFNLDDAYEQGWNDLQKCIESLPSAQRTGRWIDTDTTWSAITDNATIQIPAKICSKCGKPIPQIMWKNYCPNCGARMEVEE